MATPSRELILDEIRRTAEANGGQALGRVRFIEATGITGYDLGRYWAKFGDAVKEAGYEPQPYQQAFDMDRLVGAYATVVRRLGHVPTQAELRLECGNDPALPHDATFRRLGTTKHSLLQAVVDHLSEQPDNADVRGICQAALDATPARATPEPPLDGATTVGVVYLIKGRGGEYKLGRTGLDADRRRAQLSTGSAVELEIVHEIKTDDPAGVEAYWHRRFADRRLRGEWFKLTAADVRAVKRWRRIY